MNRKVFIFPVLCFPDMAPDPIIEARAAEGHVTVLWGGDDLIGRMKELAKTQTIHRPPTAERIAEEVELIQPGMGHPAGAPGPASAPANADAVVETAGRPVGRSRPRPPAPGTRCPSGSGGELFG